MNSYYIWLILRHLFRKQLPQLLQERKHWRTPPHIHSAMIPLTSQSRPIALACHRTVLPPALLTFWAKEPETLTPFNWRLPVEAFKRRDMLALGIFIALGGFMLGSFRSIA